jgi:hypothetical protein
MNDDKGDGILSISDRKYMRTTLLEFNNQRAVTIFTDVSGQPICPIFKDQDLDP